MKNIFNFFKIRESFNYSFTLDEKINFHEKPFFIFIHIPKNAGTSISRAVGFDKISHIKACEIEKKYGSKLLEEKFSFAIIRNPIERFISLYNYSRMGVSFYHNNIEPSKSIFGKHLDYEVLKNSSIYECALLLKENKLRHDNTWNQWEPQYTWVYDETMKKKLVKKIYYMDNLGELERDLKCFFNFKIELNEFNKSEKNEELNELDDKTITILKEYYKKDFELFNFK